MGRKGIITAACIVAGLAVVGASAFLGYRAVRAAAGEAAACESVQQQIDDRGEVVTIPGTGGQIAVIGDSYSAGDALDDWRDGWVFQLAAATGNSVTDHAVGWTGFVSPGVCGDGEFDTRLPAANATGAETLIIQGGLNDARDGSAPADVAEAARALIRSAEASRVIVVGPVDAPAIEGEDAIDAALSEAVPAAGAVYVSALEWDLPFEEDDVHLTPAGHVSFAERVTDAVQATG